MSFSSRPALAAVAGALCIASSGPLVRLADVAPATAALFRCLYAVPVLVLLAVAERRRFGPLPARAVGIAAVAGVFFALDLVLWHHAIAAVGAGLATVLGNLQVVVVGAVAWLVLRERPERRLLVAGPVVLAGVVLISGVVGTGAYGEDPARGVVYGLLTSVAYALFLLVLRAGASDERRPAGPLCVATAVAALAAAASGPVAGGLALAPTWPAHGWLALLALSAQVVGWLLISVSLPRLPAVLTSLLLLVQPLAAMLLAAAVLGERPSSLQLLGAGVVLVGVAAAARRRTPRKTASVAHQPEERLAA